MSSQAGAPMRLCLLGCGRLADAHSGRLGCLRPAVTLSYASRTMDKARTLASRHGGVHAFGSYREAVDHADIDVVAVLTPPSSHLEWTLAALSAGKDVILEKPPVLASSDFDEIERACRASGRFVYVAEELLLQARAGRDSEGAWRGCHRRTAVHSPQCREAAAHGGLARRSCRRRRRRPL